MLQGLRDQNFGLGRCRGCLASVPAVAKKGVGEMKLKRGEERGLSLGMNQGRRQKKERCQKNLNCQKICYNAFVPEMAGMKKEPKQKFTLRRYRSKAFGGSSQRCGEGGRRAESAKSTPQDRVKKSFCFPFPGSLRTAGRLTVEDRTLQFSSFPFLPPLAKEAMFKRNSSEEQIKRSRFTHSSGAYSNGLCSQP